MEWMTTRREELGLLCFLFCVTVRAYYYCYYYHYCYCWPARYYLLTATDLSMFERGSAVMVHPGTLPVYHFATT